MYVFSVWLVIAALWKWIEGGKGKAKNCNDKSFENLNPTTFKSKATLVLVVPFSDDVVRTWTRRQITQDETEQATRRGEGESWKLREGCCA